MGRIKYKLIRWWRGLNFKFRAYRFKNSFDTMLWPNGYKTHPVEDVSDISHFKRIFWRIYKEVEA